MAARRRASPRRGGRWPGWVLIVLGLVIGAAVAWGAHLYITRSAKRNEVRAEPNQTTRVPRPTPAPAAKKPEPPKSEPPRPTPSKPRFDFYTILPEIETVLPDKEPRKPQVAKHDDDVRYILQAASFANFDDADRLKAKLALSGLEARIEKISIEGKGDFYRVRLGPYAKLEQLEAQDKKLDALGVKAIRIKVKKAAT